MTEKRQDPKTTLVLCGTGKTGRRVAHRLTARGLRVRIGSRSGEPPFDWQDQATWEPAVRNVTSAYLVYYPDLGAPGAAAAVRSFAELAVDSGVRRLVLLSGRGEEGVLPAEQAVRECGADWTILRSSWFSQNFSEDFLLEPVQSGEIALPAGNVAEPFVDAEDAADVAVEALTEDRHLGQVYELTGPWLLTFADAAAEIAAAAEREVKYRSVPPEQFASMLVEHGVPAENAAFLTELFGKVLDGRNAHLTDGVQRALGRQPRDFTDYARVAAASGVWAGDSDRSGQAARASQGG
jgi:uncharacterized protein YbjT (DUF2867 family)